MSLLGSKPTICYPKNDTVDRVVDVGTNQTPTSRSWSLDTASVRKPEGGGLYFSQITQER